MEAGTPPGLLQAAASEAACDRREQPFARGGCGLHEYGYGPHERGCGLHNSSCGLHERGCGLHEYGCGLHNSSCGLHEGQRHKRSAGVAR